MSNVDERLLPQPAQFGNDWLNSINPVIMPEQISWWPQTLGWYLVLCLFLLGLACWVWSWSLARQKDAYRRRAIRKIDDLQRLSGQNEQNKQEALRQLSKVLRQVALVNWQRRSIVPLTGRSWLKFFNDTGSEQPPALLTELAYLPSVELSAIPESTTVELFRWSKQWVTEHRQYSDRYPQPKIC